MIPSFKQEDLLVWFALVGLVAWVASLLRYVYLGYGVRFPIISLSILSLGGVIIALQNDGFLPWFPLSIGDMALFTVCWLAASGIIFLLMLILHPPGSAARHAQ